LDFKELVAFMKGRLSLCGATIVRGLRRCLSLFTPATRSGMVLLVLYFGIAAFLCVLLDTARDGVDRQNLFMSASFGLLAAAVVAVAGLVRRRRQRRRPHD
jgi:hypothetical protein